MSNLHKSAECADLRWTRRRAAEFCMFDAPMLGKGSADRVHSGDARGRRRVRRLLLRPPRRDGVELVPVGVSTFVGSGLAGEAIADHHPCSLAVLIPITVIKPGAQKRPRASIEHLGRDLIWHETGREVAPDPCFPRSEATSRAVAEGFEPSVDLRPQTLSRRSP